MLDPKVIYFLIQPGISTVWPKTAVVIRNAKATAAVLFLSFNNRISAPLEEPVKYASRSREASQKRVTHHSAQTKIRG